MRVRSRLACLLAIATVLTACTSDEQPGPEPTGTPPPIQVVDLTIGVWGTEEEIAAYHDVVDLYDQLTDEVTIELEASRPTRSCSTRSRRATSPTCFSCSVVTCPTCSTRGLTQPIGERLDERDVQFGDDYSRAALEAFSFDRDLQCMPYGVSPYVVYYNTNLIDFDKMARRGLDVPNLDPDAKLRWSLDEFRTAAEFATRPRRGTSGLFVPPTLDGLAPFVLSGGGRLFDDDEDPTSLAFSSDDSRSALETVLPVLRDPLLTLSTDRLARASASTWFARNKLGMIIGDRSLTPELRRVRGLQFGVMPMPTVNDAATVGELTGICIAADTPDLAESADLLVDFVSTDAARRVVPVGYLVPANQTVALTDDFLQPTRLPARADVFNESVRDLYIPPLLPDGDALDEAVAPGIEQLLTVEIPDLDALTTLIDEASRTVLSPFEPPSPSESPSG